MSKLKPYKTDFSDEELMKMINENGAIEPNVDEIDVFLSYMNTEPSETEFVRHMVVYWFYLEWKKRGNGFNSPPVRMYVFYRRLYELYDVGFHRDYHVKIKRAPYDVDRKTMKLIKKEKLTWDKSRKGIK